MMHEEYTMDATAILLLSSTLLSIIINSIAVDTIRANQTIRDGDTITSARGEFQLGFFSPGSSTNRYLGIWYKKISNGTVVWVANRDTPIKNNMGVMRVDGKGITVQTVDGIVWSSNVSKTIKNPVAQLLETGNLVIRDDDHEIKSNARDFIWQSFDYPGDTFIPGMKAGIDLVTGLDSFFGLKVLQDISGLDHGKIDPNGIFIEKFGFNKKEIYYMFDLINGSSANVRRTITPNGDTKHLIWNHPKQIWIAYFTDMASDSDIYGFCGANDICNINSSPRCECLRGFVPKSPDKCEAAWKCYNEGKLSGLVDEVTLELRKDEVSLESKNRMQVFRVIQIGLLCVQEYPIDRPVMSQVVLMLSSNMKLPHPKKPGFFMERIMPDKEHLLRNNKFSSANQLTVTAILPRE
ncbi:hypothetical protein AgCh_018312 [Apium graveolens]